MFNRLFPAALIAATTLLLPLAASAQTTFSGNGATGFGGVLGNGSLTVSSTETSATAGTVTFTFNPSGSFGSDDVVLYIDSVAGGFSDTSTFSDNGDGGREAISGYNAGNPSRTTATFASGFGADYAISFENTIFNGAFGLASGGNNSLNYITGVTPGSPDSITLTDSQLGITPGSTIKFVGTLISTTAYRSNEAIGNIGSISNPGFSNPITYSNFDSYTTAAPAAAPEPSGLVSLVIGMAVLGGLTIARRRSVILS